MRKVLVIGAGVIGSLTAHALCEAGNDVTILARGETKERLINKGLVLQDHFTKKRSVDHPGVIEWDELQEEYDIAFAVMQYGQMKDTISDLKKVKTKILVLVGNNLSAKQMKNSLETDDRKVLFAFQSTGGERYADCVEYVSFGKIGMTIGDEDDLNADEKNMIDSLFADDVSLTWEKNMDAWLKYHGALILPIAWLCYGVDCDLKRVTGKDINLCLDAEKELYRCLRVSGYPVTPAGDDLYFEKGWKRSLVMYPMFRLMGKTKMGDLAAANHCKSAVKEMKLMEEDFFALCPGAMEMKAVKELKSMCPDWSKLL